MAESIRPSHMQRLVRVEPEDRLVVLARTIHAPDAEAEAALREGVADRARFGETCLGQALYRHRSLFRNASEAPVWSHLELRYFRDLVPAEAIHDLVVGRQPAGIDLLRAEILLTTPSSFLLPRDWQGSADRPERQASLEYIDVQPSQLGAYRKVMRDYCGPAAAKLARADRIGTFRSMETAVLLYRDPGLRIDWNQIHLCEVEAEGFEGFGEAFEAALQEDAPDGAAIAGFFAGLDRLRTVPRWTFNDAVVEADAALGRAGRLEP